MSGERFTLDTNLLLYAVDNRDPQRQATAQSIAGRAVMLDCALTNQSLTEFYVNARRKLGMTELDAATQVRN